MKEVFVTRLDPSSFSRFNPWTGMPDNRVFVTVLYNSNMNGNTGQAPPFYTKEEEWANSLSHGIGTGLAVYGLYTLLVLAVSTGDTLRLLSFSLYGFSLIFVFLSSTLYHSFQNPPVKYFFRLMDHAGIFLLIAGTYTPFTLVTLNGTF